MFTGIVEEVGRVEHLSRSEGSGRLAVACRTVLEGTAPGDSISVEGCCLTATQLPGHGFVADMMGETLARTALGGLQVGSAVNLERPVRADARLGGHLVQGHVDGVAQVSTVVAERDWTAMTFAVPEPLAAYIAEKGSVTVSGVSLTVTAVTGHAFSVGLIPHTLASTTLGAVRAGDRVNVEVDVLAKYVERLMGARLPAPAPVPGPRTTTEES